MQSILRGHKEGLGDGNKWYLEIEELVGPPNMRTVLAVCVI
jgi:hypothetical protein